MKAIIIGNGSIGKRHLLNLKEMGESVVSVDIDEINNIDSILENNNFDFGLVCSPTNLHLEHTLKLAEHGVNFFCEKPFFADKDINLISQILKLVEEKSLINMVGCNLRFHPVVKSFDYSGVYNINVFFGYDLRKWHNDGKHLESYSANKNMGGGVLIDAIHEFDYLYNWFGTIKKISGTKKRIGTVTVDTEDVVDAEVLFESGVKAKVHLDYLQPEYTRYFEVIRNNNDKEKYKIEPCNQMYVDEIKYFIDCVRERKVCMNNINEATYLLDNVGMVM